MPTNATAMAWGRGVHSQLGIRLDADGEEMKPQPALQTVPQPALGLPQAERAVLIATGETFTVLVTSRGATYVCGSNGDGELADARNSDGSMLGMCSRPHRALLKHDILRVACGARHAIALSAAGAAFAWGRNSSGQLGDNSITSRRTPVLVCGLTGLTFCDVAAGYTHVLALTTGGTVWAWGSSTWGELGNDIISARCTAVAVCHVGISFVSVAANNNGSMAVDATGGIYVWGDGTWGQLGNGSGPRTTPVSVNI